LWKLQKRGKRPFFSASLNDLILSFASLGDGDSNALILPAKRMKKKKGKEQVETVEHAILFVQFCMFTNFV